MVNEQAYDKTQLELAKLGKALSHPVRIAILQLLQAQACCYHGDMAEELPVAKSTLSQHLNELKAAGLIQGEITPPSVKYCIHKKNWETAGKILNDLFGKLPLVENCENN